MIKHIDRYVCNSYAIDYYAGDELGLVVFSTKNAVRVAPCVLYKGEWVAFDEHDTTDIKFEPPTISPRLSIVTYPQMAYYLARSPFTKREAYSILGKIANSPMNWADFGLTLLQASHKVRGRRRYECFLFASFLIF